MTHPEKLIATNRRARRDYAILDTFEAGIVLAGTEVKSLRNKGVDLHNSFARVVREEVFIHDMHIRPYEFGNRENPEPTRPRKLLLHRKEISKLIGFIDRKGYSLIPLKLYFKGSLVKVQLGVGKGKTSRDKRQDVKKREHNLEMRKALKYRQRR